MKKTKRESPVFSPETSDYKKLPQEEQLDMRLMRMKQLVQYTSLSRAHIYSLIENGEFPSGILISSGIRAWYKSSIDKWIDERMGKAA